LKNEEKKLMAKSRLIKGEEERRSDVRFNCRIPMKYEKVKEEGSITVPTIIRDISSGGLSFYTFEVLKLNSLVKVSFPISSTKLISFVTKVRRIERSLEEKMGTYVVGVEIEECDEETERELVNFLSHLDIQKILDKINLKDVIDIHLVGGYPPMVKKFDKIVPIESEPLSKEVVRGLLLNLLSAHQYKVFIEEKEMNFIFPYRDTRFRVNLHFQQGNVEGTLRVIPPKIKTLKELRLPPVVEKLLNNKKGLILVAGRTGAGKTTTLASMVDYINNNRDGIIITIEDPIEYVYVNKRCIIKQREVGKDTLSFFNAAKNALRQNPDILVIGEILDADTMEVAFTTAESGTLVLASFHAPTSAYVLDRITALFPADLQQHILKRLSLTLIGVITQELIPKIDGEGSVLACEVLVVNDAMRRIIRRGDWKQIPTMLQTGRAEGMQSMEDSLKGLYEEGLISGEYLLRGGY